jgi:hypothetical protein
MLADLPKECAAGSTHGCFIVDIHGLADVAGQDQHIS